MPYASGGQSPIGRGNTQNQINHSQKNPSGNVKNESAQNQVRGEVPQRMTPSGLLQTKSGQQQNLNQGFDERQTYKNFETQREREGAKKNGFLKGIIPPSFYDPKSKKIFGFLSAEDLFLVALIFLFLEKDDGDNTLMVIALLYILISDYIDLPEIGL